MSTALPSFTSLAEAAVDRAPIGGLTHNFYRYPARFSPRFAAVAIASFSRPGDLILDPYMGGGTAVVEGAAAGRHAVGNDLNSLAAFIAKVKVTPLSPSDVGAVRQWITKTVPNLSYWSPTDDLVSVIDVDKTRNLSLVRARFIKKAVASALVSVAEMPSQDAQDFAKCVLLRVGQWALDGRRCHTPLRDFRKRLASSAEEMLRALRAFRAAAVREGGEVTILNGNAADLHRAAVFHDERLQAQLVVTSPPYPGVHVLYHRWQVDGRRETPAPYWIAGCQDGQGAAYYNFSDRRQAGEKYFEASLATLTSIRRVMRDGSYIIQMVAFSNPSDQLPRYLENMKSAGFSETATGSEGRIWRRVPHRKWHASLQTKRNGAHEVVLIHRAT